MYVLSDLNCFKPLSFTPGYIIPSNINPVILGDGDDEWEDDITAIGAAELDASLEAAENFEEFIRTEYQDELIHHPPAVDSTASNDGDGQQQQQQQQQKQHNISLTSQSSEQDRFLESINWDEVLND